MSDQSQNPLHSTPDCHPECMSIHTKKITDSCRDKDCIEDLRVYLTKGSQALLDTASAARVRSAELLYTYIDVEPVAFDHNHYCIDVTFYYRILADAVINSVRPATIYGLAVFSKRAVLCGEDSRAHIYTSDTRLKGPDGPTKISANKPTAVVEVLDPMVLGSKVRDAGDPQQNESTHLQIPAEICAQFDDELITCCNRQRLFVTLGQFSIIRLERDVQMVVPVLDYALPTKECCDSPGCTEDPCEMFSKIPFPAAQFSPKGCDDPSHCGCASASGCSN